jgi:hypothetical protein
MGQRERASAAALSNFGTQAREPSSSDLPVGQFFDCGVQSHFKKYSASPLTQISSGDSPSRPERGALAIVTDVGAGCGGRGGIRRVCGRRAGWRKTRERPNGAQTNDAEADGKTVWSWRPLLVSSWRRRVGPTGLRQTLIRR